MSTSFSSTAICRDNYGLYVRYEENPRYPYDQLRYILYSIGALLGLPPVDTKICDPGENFQWILDLTELTSNKTRTLAWSNCTIDDMKQKTRKNLACLNRRIEPLNPFCGNGLVDKGEQCDCISVECQKCCDNNCKLTKGSDCSNGPCCDRTRCMFTDSAAQCRAADDSCDIPELCDGKSSECPPNYVVANGYKCQKSANGSYCFNGKCGKIIDVCEWVFKKGQVALDSCYELNKKNDTTDGGCGPTFQSIVNRGKYTACSDANKFCGKLFCDYEGSDQGAKPYTPESFRPFEGKLSISGIIMDMRRFLSILKDDTTLL